MSNGYVQHQGKRIQINYAKESTTIIYIYKDDIFEIPSNMVKCTNCEADASNGNHIGDYQVCQTCFIQGMTGKLTAEDLFNIDINKLEL